MKSIHQSINSTMIKKLRKINEKEEKKRKMEKDGNKRKPTDNNHKTLMTEEVEVQIHIFNLSFGPLEW